MKRRIRTQPTNPFYSNEPAVAVKSIADKPPVQNASLGNKSPKMVDKHPGRITGVAGFTNKARPPAKKLPVKTKAAVPPAKKVPQIKAHANIKSPMKPPKLKNY
jgi:hypothetical protein